MYNRRINPLVLKALSIGYALQHDLEAIGESVVHAAGRHQGYLLRSAVLVASLEGVYPSFHPKLVFKKDSTASSPAERVSSHSLS